MGAKETACGCAGIYTAHAAIELYAEAFEDAGALDRLEAFASFYGADFYGLPRNTDTITLKRESWNAPASLRLGVESLVPLRAGEASSVARRRVKKQQTGSVRHSGRRDKLSRLSLFPYNWNVR